MQERNERYWDLMAMYLKGEISEQEKTELFDWAEQEPANKEVFYRSTYLWQLTGKSSDAFQSDVTQAWKRFLDTIESEKETKNVSAQPEARVLSMWWLRVAAVVVVMAGIGYWLLRNPLTETSAMVTMQAGDQKKDFYLPDGSHIFLNRNSRLAYTQAMKGAKRIVHLKGEAFFDVKPNKEQPFVIHTNYSKVEVVGTSFTVREDSVKGITEVAVISGKVAFSGVNPSDESRLYLTPGFTGVYDYTKGLLSEHTIDNPNFMAWKVDRLMFTNTRMESVIATMKSYFGVQIQVKNPQLLNCRFTGTFEKPALEEMVKVLALSINLQVEKQSNQYTFSGQGCNKN